MMAHAEINEKLNNGLWIKCAATATKLENIMVNPHKEKRAYEKLYGEITDYAKYLRTFGEVGVVHSIATIEKKLEDQGMACIFLYYAQNHNDGTYHMLNLSTRRIVLRCDVIWIKNTTESTYQEKNTKASTYILQYKEESYNWAHVKIDPVKTEFKTENVKTG